MKCDFLIIFLYCMTFLQYVDEPEKPDCMINWRADEDILNKLFLLSPRISCLAMKIHRLQKYKASYVIK